LTGIPVCAKIGAIYPPASFACMAFMGTSAISYEYELANKFVEGGIGNGGSRCGSGYDVDEYVYVRISRYKYKWYDTGACYFDALA